MFPRSSLSWLFLLCAGAAQAMPDGVPIPEPTIEVPPVTAENYAPPEYIRSMPRLPQSWVNKQVRRITRSEAIELALRRNLDLELEREQVRIQDFARTRAFGAYEPRLHIWGGRTSSQSPPQTAQEGAAGQVYQSTTDSWNLSLSELLPTATLLSLSFNNNRFETNQANAVLPVRYYPSMALSLSQPLLQGFSFDGRVQWAPLLSAKFASEKEREQARLQALIVVKATEDAYWNLQEKWKTYDVQRGAYELAEKQLDLTRRQIAAGIVPPSELLSIQGRLAQVQVDVVRAEVDIEDAADSLRQLLNLPPEEWEQPLLPVDAPSFTRGLLAFDAAFDRAVAFRPELSSAHLDMRQAVLDLVVAKNRRLPQLNFSAGVSAVGQDAAYGQALSQMAGRSGWQWNVGLDLNWEPIGVKTRSDISSQQSVLRQKRISREKVLMNIRSDVRAALRAIENAERQVYASAQSRDLSERNLALDHRRFLNGLPGVDNFKLAQRQGELATARLTEIRALLQHERALSLLLLATGELLEVRQLKFELRTGG